nr:hypothetical protein [Tanacetum cinerariifolium]
MNQNYFEPSYSGFDQPQQYYIDHQEDLNQQQMNNAIKDKIKESHNELLNMLKLFFEHILRQREQMANLSINITEPSRRLNSFCYDDDDDDDDDDEERTIPLCDIISQLPPSIVITTSPPILPIEDPEVSLIMRNEELNTIPEKKSDEFIKSSDEDLVLITSESEDTSESDSECILPSCDYFSPIDIPMEKSRRSGNNVKIYSNPLFEFDDEYISSDVNPLFDEVLENIESKDSYDSNFDEPDLLFTPLSDANKDECFDSGGDDDEINVLDFRHDPSIPVMSVASILEGFTDEPPLEENDDLFDLESKENEWKKILYDAQIDDLISEDKVFYPEICVKKISPTYSEDTIFDLGIYAFHISHRSGTFISFNVYPNILNESPMGICSSTCFTPNITMIWGESS